MNDLCAPFLYSEKELEVKEVKTKIGGEIHVGARGKDGMPFF
jgi:hypothetical protein